MGKKANAKDWKAITMDWTALQSYDHSEIIGVCLTQREVAILKALLTTAYWPTRWTGLTATADELDEFVANIDSQLDGNDCGVCNMEFRDNPADPCEVQYSLDAGDTWTTMFRKDNCPPQTGTTVADIDQTYIDITTVTTNNTTWNNNIINVAPDWAYVDSDSDLALCYTIGNYVDWICDFAIKQIEGNNQNLRDSNDWLDDISTLLAAAVMDLIVSSAGTLTLPAVIIGAVTWASVQIVEGVWDYLVATDSSQFADEDARDTIKCWMWNHIRGETPQFVEWSTSLDDFDYGSATIPEQSIASTVALFNIEADIYVNWMILMEDINSISAGLPACDCPQPLIIDQLAGPTGLEMYGTEYTSPSNKTYSNPGDSQAFCPGVYVLGTDTYVWVASSIGGVGCNIRVALPPNVLVTEVKILWGGTRVPSTGGGDKNACAYLGDPTAGGTFIMGHSWGVTTNPQSITTHVSNPAGLTPTPESMLYVHNSMDREDGTAYIQWIHIECIPYP